MLTPDLEGIRTRILQDFSVVRLDELFGGVNQKVGEPDLWHQQTRVESRPQERRFQNAVEEQRRYGRWVVIQSPHRKNVPEVLSVLGGLFQRRKPLIHREPFQFLFLLFRRGQKFGADPQKPKAV